MVVQAIAQALVERADIICFPECFVPGYRGWGSGAATRLRVPGMRLVRHRNGRRKATIAVVLGTERVPDGALYVTALVIHRGGTIAGFQDKAQLDPSEEGIYSFGSGSGFSKPDR